jgi:hypothetical protein
MLFTAVTPCSRVGHRRFGGTYWPHIHGWKVSLSKKYAAEIQTTRSYVPDDNIPHSHGCETNTTGTFKGQADYYVLVSYWFALIYLTVHSVLRASQRELTRCLPFPSCFLYIPKISLSRLLCLPPAFTLVSFMDYTSNLKMETTYFSETSVDFQRTTRCCIPEDIPCENLK